MTFKLSDVASIPPAVKRGIESLRTYSDAALATEVATLVAADAALTAADVVLTAADTATAALFESGTYTPTLTGMAVGTGGGAANTADWTAVKCGTFWQMHIEGDILFGTAGATLPTAAITATLPTGWQVSAAARQYDYGAAIMRIGSSSFDGRVVRNSTTTFAFRHIAVSGTVVRHTTPTSTTPGTWAIGDSIPWVATLRVTKV